MLFWGYSFCFKYFLCVSFSSGIRVSVGLVMVYFWGSVDYYTVVIFRLYVFKG